MLSHVLLFASPWTIAHQAPLSVEFVRQEYCSGLPLSSPGYLPNSGIKPGSPALQVDSLPSEAPINNTHTHTHTHTQCIFFYKKDKNWRGDKKPDISDDSLNSHPSARESTSTVYITNDKSGIIDYMNWWLHNFQIIVPGILTVIVHVGLMLKIPTVKEKVIRTES